MRVLSFTPTNAQSIGMRYVAGFYWAVYVTTGLNTSIVPGERTWLVMYECLVALLGICLQVRVPPVPAAAAGVGSGRVASVVRPKAFAA